MNGFRLSDHQAEIRSMDGRITTISDGIMERFPVITTAIRGPGSISEQ